MKKLLAGDFHHAMLHRASMFVAAVAFIAIATTASAEDHLCRNKSGEIKSRLPGQFNRGRFREWPFRHFGEMELPLYDPRRVKSHNDGLCRSELLGAGLGFC